MIDHARFELHRLELTGLCRRMLGASEAEDAVQETFIRAWRGGECFEGRSSLRSWLRRIATNVCLDVLDGRKRRTRPASLAADDPIADESAEQAVLARESVRLALVVAVQRLPPMQRAALILREVLRWHAAEAAELLGTSVPSVNSALQRARATLGRGTSPTPADLDPPSAELLTRYVTAFERCDIDALTSVVQEDAGRGLATRRRASEAPLARTRRPRPRPASGRAGGASSARGSRGS